VKTSRSTIALGALVVAGIMAITGCTRDGAAPGPTTSPTPTVTDTAVQDPNAMYLVALANTRNAGGVAVDIRVQSTADGQTRADHRFTGLLDLSSGDADGTVNRAGRPEFRRLSIAGTLIDQIPGTNSWLRSTVNGQGLIGTDTSAVFDVLTELQNVSAESLGGGNRFTGTLSPRNALRISGLPQEDVAVLTASIDAATVVVTIDVDADGFITSWTQRITVDSETLGLVEVVTTAILSEYGQVVIVETPSGEILDAPGE
jgi:hypothetical protein